MRTKLFCITHFSLIIFAAFFLTACDSEAPVAEKTEVLVRPAKLLQVGLANRDNFLNYPAVIKFQDRSALSFAVGGTVKELPVIEAQEVKKGDVLAKLDQRDLLAKLSSARAQYKNANIEYERAVNLVKADAISRSKLDERKSQRDVNKSALETAQKALQDSVLVAPFDGAIAKVSIKKRQVIQAGADAITILGEGKLEAKINLPSSLIAKSQQREKSPESSYVVLDAAPGRRISAVYKEISLEADAATQTYEITFTFESPQDLVILPGMNGVVWLKDPDKSGSDNKISIPLTAIATDGNQKYVWVVNSSSMTVLKRNIVIEPDVGSTLVVNSGLESGETIVAAGISILFEGMKVSAWSE